MSSIHIAAGLDRNYVACCAAMLRSVRDSMGPNVKCTAHLLDAGIGLANRVKIELSLMSRRMKLIWYQVKPEQLENLVMTDHINGTAYARLLLPRLLSNSVERVLYLDCDLLVFGGLEEIYNTDTMGLSLAAVQADSMTLASPRGVRRYRELGYSGQERYLNSGVLLMELNEWRRTGISERIFAYLEKYREDVILHDQDGINAVLGGQWKELPHWFNFRVDCTEICDGNMRWILPPDVMIAHWASMRKPWHPGVTHPSVPFYRSYMKRTLPGFFLLRRVSAIERKAA